MVKRFEESGHPVFKSISALSRTIHSASQLSIYGAVACWCKEFGLSLDETSEKLMKTEKDQILTEVNSLVQTPRNHEPASENRLRDCIFGTFRHWRKKSNS